MGSLSPIPPFLFTGGASGMGENREFAAHGGHGSRVRRSRRTSHRHRRRPRREGPSSSSSSSLCNRRGLWVVADFATSDSDRRGSLGCGGFVCVFCLVFCSPA
nr:hypothetical protein CFP56_06228 [Quercus suber]